MRIPVEDLHDVPPLPVVPSLPRRRVEHRAIATIRDALRSTPSLHERLIELRDVHAYEAAHEQERALACGAGETKREHDVAAAEHAGMERILSAVLSLHGGNVQREEPAETGTR